MPSTLDRRIDELVLVSNAPAASDEFLRACLPTLAAGSTSEDFASVRFVGRSDLAVAVDGPSGPFWKFSVFTDDLDQLRRTILAEGIDVSEPVQFGDIGYLCHLREPGGIEIELLQRTFRDNPRSNAKRQDGLGLITLRVRDADESAQFYVDELNMKALTEMPVDDGRVNPFDLYFYGLTDDDPPHQDLSHVDNREWLYQRPFTIVELQHYRRASDFDSQAGVQEVGLASVSLNNLGRNAESPDGHRFIAG